MEKHLPMKIVMLGAGNLATNLAMALKNKGHEIVQVYSQTEVSAEQLARKTVSEAITRLNRLVHDADIYVLSVKDDAIETLLQDFPVREGFLVHTAGSVSIEVLKGHAARYGVLYPLQTFSKERPVDFSNIPLCLEADSHKSLSALETLASDLSGDIRHISSRQRAHIHVAAVFACNFTNYMLAKAEEILSGQQVSFDIVDPLVRETIEKALHHSPARAQTGPARRGDNQTMDHHLNLLAHSGKLQNLYSFVSNAIANDYADEQNQEE